LLTPRRLPQENAAAAESGPRARWCRRRGRNGHGLLAGQAALKGGDTPRIGIERIEVAAEEVHDDGRSGR
jgi:hypothetical protein